MGFFEELFLVNPVRDEYKCPICQDVLDEPLTIVTCDHVFCSLCIKVWLGLASAAALPGGGAAPPALDPHNNCPVCNQVVRDKNNDLKPSLRQFREVLNSLQLRCSFDQCEVTLPLSSFRRHQENCPCNPINAPYQCPKFCGADIRRNEEHDCQMFLTNKVMMLKMETTEQFENLAQLTEDNRMNREELTKIRELNQQLTEQSEITQAELLSLIDENKQLRAQNNSLTEQHTILEVKNEQLNDEIRQRDRSSDDRVKQLVANFEVASAKIRQLEAELEQCHNATQELEHSKKMNQTIVAQLESINEQYELLSDAHLHLQQLYDDQSKLNKMEDFIKQNS